MPSLRRDPPKIFRPAEQVLDGLGINGRRILVEIGVPEAFTAGLVARSVARPG